MLISPPFLPARGTDQLDESWLEQAMQGGFPGQGGYPVSYNLGWHGGIHLEAPSSGNVRLPVRAIADGTVVYVRQPTDRPCDMPEDHPLNYRGGWTSDGCVVIKHETEIGAAANGAATAVTFYSITMHLNAIRPTVRKGKPIYRKDEIGQAGYIYGDLYKIHFEIICDDGNLARLIGRTGAELNTGADGRTDAVYGEMYFRLPDWTEIYLDKPKPNELKPSIPAVHTLAKPLYVGMRYAGGDEAQGKRGDLNVSTYREDGSRIDTPLSEHDAEYKLYTSATDISDAYRAVNAQPHATQTPVPAPSAVYELLRFGRILGPDALNPADTPHWRKISYEGGQGWVNLNASGITKFSDADFPPWKAWQLIDDSADLDSRCDSPTIKNWLDEDNDGKVDPNEAVSLLPNDDIQAKMRRTICKIPTEWEKATVDARWNWLTKESEENPAPLSDADFLTLREHIETLAFWEDANIGISTSHWHFQPREFIRQFRMCGWLSLDEMARTFPRYPTYTQTGAIRSAITSGSHVRTGEISLVAAKSRLVNHVTAMNQVMKRYGISTSRTRQSQFLAQVFLETDKWRTMEEYGRGAANPKLPMAQYYGAFYGRGVLQLTWAGNYELFGKFRNFPNHSTGQYGDNRLTATSTHYKEDPTKRNAKGAITGLDPKKPATQWFPRYDPDDIHLLPFNACDSGGFFWVSKHHDGHRDINRVADQGFTLASVGKTSVLVNGGGNGYYERQAYAQVIARMLTDSTEVTRTVQFTTPRNNVVVNVDFSNPA